MNIRIAQINNTAGKIESNKELILKHIKKAEEDQVDVLVFPELAVIAKPLSDKLLYQKFRQQCFDANQEIINQIKSTTVIFGTIQDAKTEYKCANSVIIAQNGKVKSQNTPNKTQNDEPKNPSKYFTVAEPLSTIKIDGVNFGITISSNFKGLDLHANIDVLIDISSTEFTKTSRPNRIKLLTETAKNRSTPIIYVNNVGANGEYIYDGGAFAVNKNGQIITTPVYFEENTIDLKYNAESKDLTHSTQKISISNNYNKIEASYNALKLGITDYLKKSKAAEKVIIGLSGGIDSALTCAIASDALGAENVIAVTMPSKYSSDGSVEDSKLLAKNLGIQIHNVPINSIYDAFLEELNPFFENTSFNVAEENIQARTRGDLLMALANKFGYMVLTNSNKSEFAVGYCTLYGDMAGGLAVIGDLYKTEVYEMCNWLNERYYKKEIIPRTIIDKVPSAELRPDQKDTDSLPEYEILDNILISYIEHNLMLHEIVSKFGYEKEIVNKVLNLVDRSEFKRRQAAPILKLTDVTFGINRNWLLI